MMVPPLEYCLAEVLLVTKMEQPTVMLRWGYQTAFWLKGCCLVISMVMLMDLQTEN